MSLNGVDLIAIAFGFFNLLRLASFFPQIVAIARDRHGAAAISLTCWSVWIGANATTALYAWVKLGDTTLTVVNALNAAGCAIVVLLAMYKRAVARGPQLEMSPRGAPAQTPSATP